MIIGWKTDDRAFHGPTNIGSLERDRSAQISVMRKSKITVFYSYRDGHVAQTLQSVDQTTLATRGASVHPGSKRQRLPTTTSLYGKKTIFARDTKSDPS